MLKYYRGRSIDFFNYYPFLNDSQYPCETVSPDETNFLGNTKWRSEVYGQFVQQAQCACIGCRYFVTSKFVEGYCCNSQSTWYLQRTGCRCDLKESNCPVEEHAFLEAPFGRLTNEEMNEEEESI